MKKYYTCFVYEGFAPTDLHVTHKYFGLMEEAEAIKVCEAINLWFRKRPHVVLPRVIFSRRETFAEGTEVLLPSPLFQVPALLPDLRTQLDALRADSFPSYKPHVSTPLTYVGAPFSGYAFMSNVGMIQFWRLRSELP